MRSENGKWMQSEKENLSVARMGSGCEERLGSFQCSKNGTQSEKDKASKRRSGCDDEAKEK